jgi:tRNA threonylcarbamoyladenosine biosynthesis protein TsaE
VTASAAETAALGARLAAALRPGDVVVLHGEVGAGKTTLVRGALRALGVTVPVTSPTFTIGNTYATPGGPPVAHLDLHRLGSLADEDPALLADHLDPGGLAFVEWPEVAAGELAPRVRVTLEHAGGDRRRATVEWLGP